MAGRIGQAKANVYRPAGPKQVQLGVAWGSGGSFNLAQAIDLSLPIRGMRFKFRGRLVIGTAAFTSVNPEGLLNLISNITIQGTNARQRGNITLWNIDLATAWVYAHLFGYKAGGLFTISTSGAGNDATVPVPDTPFPGAGVAVPNKASGYINGATGTYDFKITLDLPFHPHAQNVFGNQPEQIPGFLVRNEEWKDTLQTLMTFGTQAGAGATGALGVSAATTTVTFSAYNSGTGSPVIDIYSLPVLMGLDLKDTVLPGICSRAQFPLTTILQNAGSNVTLANLQKQPTPRLILKVGTGTSPNGNPAFTTLSDTNVTTLGIQLGGNRNVRNKLDIDTHKQQQVDVYGREPIQGYTMFDFIETGLSDSSYPGQDIGDGSTFQAIADITGVANGFGILVQEQIIHTPTGPLYSA